MTTRVFYFGTVRVDGYIGTHTVRVEVTLQENDNKPVFTASASCGTVMCGQCLDEIWEECQDQLKFKKLYKEIMELWQKYHLNDTNAWCEHQNYGEDIQQIVVHHLYGNEEWERLNKVRELPDRHLEVTDEGMKNVPIALYDFSTSTYFPANETKYAGHVSYDATYRPDGMLGVECPECGAKYGHGWYYMPIPENDLNRIKEIIEGY